LQRLRNKLREGIFGAKLALRLVVFFTLIAVLPGVLVYVVSVGFLGKSIESWFDVRVEKALEGGLNLGRSGLDNSLKELSKKTQFISLLLAEKHPDQYQRTLDQLVDEKVAQEAALFTLKGNLISFSTAGAALMPDIPDAELLREALERGEYSVTDTLPNKGLTLRALSVVNSNANPGARYVLQFTQPVPKQIEADAETVQAVYRDYQELTLSRLGLKRLYAITLTLSLLVVLLTAVSMAFFISERLGGSLEALAEGTELTISTSGAPSSASITRLPHGRRWACGSTSMTRACNSTATATCKLNCRTPAKWKHVARASPCLPASPASADISSHSASELPRTTTNLRGAPCSNQSIPW
jgi:nitrogen fixation/metabolism regulation signal transduction histidine kinase